MIRVGKIVATHGLQGWAVMTHITGSSDWLKNGQALMVEMQKGSLIPYFVEEFKATSNEEYMVKLEDVATVGEAKRLIKRHVYVDESVLSAYAKDSPLMWIGFQVTDVHKGLLGPIEDVMQTGTQWVATLTIDGNEVLLPLVPQMIKDVNIRNRRIIMELPDGLLEVYSG